MIKIKTCYTVANPKFSLKDSNAEFSAIRMRVFINKVRLNIHLPAEYKIKPCLHLVFHHAAAYMIHHG